MQYGNYRMYLIFFFVTKFKSYYVVWKPLTLAPMFFILFVFKSYYVVWKRFFATNLESAEPSLNRTMQYGNSLSQISKYLTVGGLNRTMQYGNLTSQTSPSYSSKQFKSYYVVWKPRNRASAVPALTTFKSYYVVWKLIKVWVKNTGNTV